MSRSFLRRRLRLRRPLRRYILSLKRICPRHYNTRTQGANLYPRLRHVVHLRPGLHPVTARRPRLECHRLYSTRMSNTTLLCRLPPHHNHLRRGSNFVSSASARCFATQDDGEYQPESTTWKMRRTYGPATTTEHGTECTLRAPSSGEIAVQIRGPHCSDASHSTLCVSIFSSSTSVDLQTDTVLSVFSSSSARRMVDPHRVNALRAVRDLLQLFPAHLRLPSDFYLQRGGGMFRHPMSARARIERLLNKIVERLRQIEGGSITIEGTQLTDIIREWSAASEVRLLVNWAKPVLKPHLICRSLHRSVGTL